MSYGSHHVCSLVRVPYLPRFSLQSLWILQTCSIERYVIEPLNRKRIHYVPYFVITVRTCCRLPSEYSSLRRNSFSLLSFFVSRHAVIVVNIIVFEYLLCWAVTILASFNLIADMTTLLMKKPRRQVYTIAAANLFSRCGAILTGFLECTLPNCLDYNLAESSTTC